MTHAERLQHTYMTHGHLLNEPISNVYHFLPEVPHGSKIHASGVAERLYIR